MSWNDENRERNERDPREDFRRDRMVRPVSEQRDRRFDLEATNEIFEPTVIGKGAKITGNIEVEGDLVINGQIKGDVTCNNKLTVNGVVEGSIATCDVEFDNTIVYGDVSCSGELHLSQSATVNGNCEAMNIVCGGRIKGDVNVQEGATFEEKAALVGNLSARDIEIHKGAVLQGNVNIRQDVYFETED